VSVYTAYEMIADCRAGRPEGRLWFARNFVPPLRVLLGHYSGGDPEPALAGLLAALRDAIGQWEPAPLRELIVALRPAVLEAAGYGVSRRDIELEAVEDALAALTTAERQMMWLETMGYDAVETARLMRASPETVASVRARGAELLRARVDHWTVTVLSDCGAALGEAVRLKPPGEPAAARDYIDLLDGRVTWQRRVELERSLAASWFEIDHFCRVREVDEAASRSRSLSDEEAAPYSRLLGVEPRKPSLWTRVLRG
jgi:hypothetical protein